MICDFAPCCRKPLLFNVRVLREEATGSSRLNGTIPRQALAEPTLIKKGSKRKLSVSCRKV